MTDTETLVDLVKELTIHISRGYGPMTRGMKDRVSAALGQRVETLRDWKE